MGAQKGDLSRRGGQAEARQRKESRPALSLPRPLLDRALRARVYLSPRSPLGGGDGGKWVCDPHEITRQAACLVYSVGVKGDIQFERGVKRNVHQGCEIHSFDLNSKTPRNRPVADLLAGVGTFHHWGITGNETQAAASKKATFKTLKTTMLELGHANTTIDILKIDCKFCEYADVHGWLADLKELHTVARQLLFEVHEPPAHPGARDFFRALQEAGYVIFHKEANSLAGGVCYEYAWVLLDPTFQKLST